MSLDSHSKAADTSWLDQIGLRVGGLMVPQPRESDSLTLVNQPEPRTFLATALAWRGSVTPRVLPRVLVAAAYSALVCALCSVVPGITLPITPFEYSGAVLALILVMRLNAGHDRWWEARKIWGSIVNQSRNLALVVSSYSDRGHTSMDEALRWIAAWPYIIRDDLRRDRTLTGVQSILSERELAPLAQADSMSVYAAAKIASLLSSLRCKGLDAIAFLRAETERSLILDAVGACERIRNTTMPLALAIKTRRFITLFILLLPLALVDRAGWVTPLVIALASYPLFSLDEIGAELQNPFSPHNLSHLPLDTICKTIASNVLSLRRMSF